METVTFTINGPEPLTLPLSVPASHSSLMQGLALAVAEQSKRPTFNKLKFIEAAIQLVMALLTQNPAASASAIAALIAAITGQ